MLLSRSSDHQLLRGDHGPSTPLYMLFETRDQHTKYVLLRHDLELLTRAVVAFVHFC